jgi:hypothetical protein
MMHETVLFYREISNKTSKLTNLLHALQPVSITGVVTSPYLYSIVVLRFTGCNCSFKAPLVAPLRPLFSFLFFGKVSKQWQCAKGDERL